MNNFTKKRLLRKEVFKKHDPIAPHYKKTFGSFLSILSKKCTRETLQNFLCLLPTKDPYHPKRVYLTNEDCTGQILLDANAL